MILILLLVMDVQILVNKRPAGAVQVHLQYVLQYVKTGFSKALKHVMIIMLSLLMVVQLAL